MRNQRRLTFKLLGLTLAVGAALPAWADHDEQDGFRSGKVFTSTNATSGNELLVFQPGNDGLLHLLSRVPTQGQGTGAGLGSQGAVTLSGDGRYAFVVNALSNTVTTLSIKDSSVTVSSVVNSGGLRPISVTEHDGIVFVLNAQGEGNVMGFRNVRGMLEPIAGASGALSASSGTNPAQVGFSSDGDTLLVTEKGTNRLTSYAVSYNGQLGARVVTASSGQTPFGFAFDRRDHALVSEAFGGMPNASALSSYAFFDRQAARPVLVSASVGTTQTAACWVAVTPNGRFAYTTNAASGTVSSFMVQRDGRLSLSMAVAANLGAGTGPTDVAASRAGRHLYVLNTGGSAIQGYRLAHDGKLSADTAVADMPRGTVGLAAN